jgi:hypothetical protein
MILGLMVLFMLFALALDAGLWFFDHRRTQTQAEAAAHAAVNVLPVMVAPESPEAAEARATVIAKADQWLGYNGSSAAERTCPVDDQDTENIPPHPTPDASIFPTPTPDTFNPPGALNTVRVCVRRTSPSIFAKLADIGGVWVSAAAKAQVRLEALPYGLMVMDGDCDNLGNLSVSGGARVNVGGPAGTYIGSHGCGTSINVDLGSQLSSSGDNHTNYGSCTAFPGAIDPPCTVGRRIPAPWQDLQPLYPYEWQCDVFSTADDTRNRPGRYCDSDITIAGDDTTVFLDCTEVVSRADCFFTFTGNFTVNQANLYYKPMPRPDAPGVALDSTSSNSNGSLPWWHTVGNLSNRVLLVGIVTGGGGPGPGGEVIYGTQAMTMIAYSNSIGPNQVKVTLFALKDPAIGTNEIHVTSTETGIAGMSASYYNVGGLVGDSSGSENSSITCCGITVPSRAGEIVVDLVGMTSSSTDIFQWVPPQTALFGVYGAGASPPTPTPSSPPPPTPTPSSPSPPTPAPFSYSGNMSSRPGAEWASMCWSKLTLPSTSNSPNPDVGWASVAVMLLPLSNEGITLYFTCDITPCDTERAGNVRLIGDGLKLGSPITPLRGNPDHQHMLIWVDRTSSDMPSPSTVDIAGGRYVFLAGRLYAYRSNVTFTGQGAQPVNLNLNIVANLLRFASGNEFNLLWTEQFAPTRRVVSITE